MKEITHGDKDVASDALLTLSSGAGHNPALLLMAEYNGTLAAARCLSEHGAPVVVGTSRLLAPARWSRSVQRVEPCPAFTAGPAQMVEWLVDFAARNGRHVLYPTCDEMAWLLAHHRVELGEHFDLYSPGGDTLRVVLDKRELYAAAAAVGIHTPRTWHPHDASELPAIWQQVSACMVKPRTQAYFCGVAKGLLSRSLKELQEAWQLYLRSSYPTEVTRDMQDVGLPMIQEFLPEASRQVYSVTGFAVSSGEIIAARASRKLLQVPRRAGVGLCFEGCDPDPGLVRQLSALCASIGYFGVFEAEFIQHEGRALLIDFNPRYFGQLGFDIARGMHLPWLAQLCALGAEEQARAVAGAGVAGPVPDYYADSVALKWHLMAGTLFGGVSREERRKWQSWLSARPDRFEDALVRRGDMVPAVAAATGLVWRALRHPRGFLYTSRPEPAEP